MISYENALTKSRDYLLEEPDKKLRDEISFLMSSTSDSAKMELIDRMDGHLFFGTAGLRQRMEAGYNRLNLVSVFRFAYALGQLLLKEHSENSSIVLGYDGRNNSQQFALEIKSVLTAMGIEVKIFDQVVATPICAFATKACHSSIGVMITASHNPKDDNGIKLYGITSAQLNGQVLKRIEHGMANAPSRLDFWSDKKHVEKSVLTQSLGQETIEKYLDAIKKTKLISDQEIVKDIKVVYTPLHGVGQKFFLAALKREGFDQVETVSEQSAPNGDFSTVDFPNPEEDNTLDLAHELATKVGANWVLANDPDADRLQVSYRNKDGRFQKLTGNEIGVIFSYFSIRKAKQKNVKPLLATSIVSSRMLKKMCADLGAGYVDAVTGFRNIAKAAKDAEKESDQQLVFAYEEAIGFLIDQIALDKDGISAGLRFMEIIGYLEKNHQSPQQLLDSLYVEFGLFMNTQWSNRFDGIGASQRMAETMAKVRSVDADRFATSLAIDPVCKYDLASKSPRDGYQNINSDMVIFETSPFFRLIIRPSGTEPKIKFYLELCEKIEDSTKLKHIKENMADKLAKARTAVSVLFA